MIKLKKVLFPTDFSRCANQALYRAYHLAKQYDAELHLLHGVVLHEDDPYHMIHHVPNLEEAHSKAKLTAMQEMDSLIRSYHANGLTIVKAQERGLAAAPIILDYAREHDIDLIVMGTHGRRGLGHLFLGSVAEEVVRLADQPVLTIREQKEPKASMGFNRVLVPVDFSEHGKAALAQAKEIAAAYNATIDLLHVVEETVHPSFYATGKTSIFDFTPDITAKSVEALKQMVEETLGPEVPTEFHVTEGRAADEIAKFSEQLESDLIVIATHGLTGLEHFMVGSVTEKVVRMARCPVFTVKSFGRSLIA
ncbi:universal stress protein [bacterium]|nr:universal stress protein [bacterium]